MNQLEIDQRLEVKCVDPITDPLWLQLVTDLRSDVFHSPEWMQVLADTYGFQVQAYVLADEAGIARAGIPFVKIKDTRGERTVALPFSDYCDPVMESGKSWDILSECLIGHNEPVKMRCLHSPEPLSDSEFTKISQAKWHGLDLQPEIDALWMGFKDSGRRAIRKASQNGFVVQVAEDEKDVRAFFNLHLKLRKYKYHMLAQPYKFFEQIWHHFLKEGKGFLLTASEYGEIVSGVLFLKWKDGLYYKFNASSQDTLNARPNDLVLWQGIQLGKSKGNKHLDFGLSDWNQEGLLQYKRKYAGEEKTISFLQHIPKEPAQRSDHHFSSLLPKLTDLFTDPAVPDDVTEKAGEALYQFFV
jgi:CelD/BcsL family acetyltransferase involved in cellulose biosynthesis